jgi:hypothetical protein
MNKTLLSVALLAVATCSVPLASAAPVAADCIPRLVSGPGGSLFLVCSTDYTCGLMQAPVCWTTRYSCTIALASVFRAYQNLLNKGGQCEGQGNWPQPPGNATGTP